MDAQVMVAVDEIRRSLDAEYDPVRGTGCCGRRTEVPAPVPGLPSAMVPVAMTADPAYAACSADDVAWRRLRCRHDFEYWCVECVRIKHKELGGRRPFVLNRPQRRVLTVLESDRLAGRPIRLILLKARQWGGSTLVQMYMAWIQCCHRRNWNSLICAHIKDAAAGIRGMYARMLADYPAQLWEGEEAPCFRPFERSSNMREIAGRECVVTLASSEKPDSVRGGDYAMAHLSEMAFWADSPSKRPDDFVRSVCGGVALLPYSLVAVESTANGVGNYFHAEWLRSREGRSDKHAVFVPWYEIDLYRLEPPDPTAFARSLDKAEMHLWRTGITLDRLYWRRRKMSEYPSAQQFCAEYPFDDNEAFTTTGAGVFDREDIDRLRAGCREPIFTGELCAGVPVESAAGCLQVWEMPVNGSGAPRYVVSADVGGTSAASDWSVASVTTFDDYGGARPRVVAQWRGHLPHDLLVDKLVEIARFYANALLVVESNTLESRDGALMEDSAGYIVNRLAAGYSNLYRRECFDAVSGRPSTRVGFHTNRSTKAMLIINLQGLLRENAYDEPCHEACNEYAVYEQGPRGTYGARQGFHDDIVMSRAIGLFVGARGARRSVGSPVPEPISW